MKAEPKCFEAVVVFPGGVERTFYVYDRYKSSAERTLRESPLPNPDKVAAVLTPLAPLRALKGKVRSFGPVGELPVGKLIIDVAPSRETRK